MNLMQGNSVVFQGKSIMQDNTKPQSPSYHADNEGYFGQFGGSYIPEMLYPNVDQLKNAFNNIVCTEEFYKEYTNLLDQYVGRPSPLFEAKRLSEKVGFQVLLKREDLNHTGSHKINNVIGQILLAKKLGKQRIIAETGAGQHGVATATVCALFGLECIVYMGEIDTKRQIRNVERMKALGATVIPVLSGSRVLKDATNEALRDWIAHPYNTHYVIGSVVGPHPFPTMVAYFQSIISKELRIQLKARFNNEFPDYVIACVGGGSNAAGGFYHYLQDASVRLVGVEAAGKGIDTEHTAATTAVGEIGVLHGSKTLLYQNQDGQVQEAYSISAGLDYPGIGPQHSHLYTTKRVQYVSVTDDEAVNAGKELMQLEGIIPALESAHALASLQNLRISEEKRVVVILSGNGEKDIETYKNHRREAV